MTKIPIAHHKKVVKRMIILQNRRDGYHAKLLKDILKPIFIVRVDDFPRWDIDTKEFEKFHEVMKNNDIPYILGVTPFLCEAPLQTESNKYRRLTGYEIDLLAKIKREKVEFALHGFTHQTIQSRFNTELIGLAADVLEKKIEESLEEFKYYNILPSCFIPPFNTFDYNNVKVIKKYFKTLFGGPESVKTVGFRLSPSWLDNMLYVPSYFPAYGRAEEVHPFVLECLKQHERIIVPLTFHWAWERRTNYRYMIELCEIIKGHTMSYEQFYSLFENLGK
jgi:hypothetical protein